MGFPERRPPCVNVKPEGSAEPACTEKTYGALPPEAEIVWEYGAYSVPDGKFEVSILRLETVRTKIWLP